MIGIIVRAREIGGSLNNGEGGREGGRRVSQIKREEESESGCPAEEGERAVVF